MGGAKEMKFSKKPSEVLLRELGKVGAIISHPETMFLSKYAIPRLAYKVGIQGEFAYENNLLRNLSIQYRLAQKEKGIRMVIREDEGIKKVFGVLTEKYQYVPLGIILSVVKGIKKEFQLSYVCREWRIDPEGAYLCIEFPTKAVECTQGKEKLHMIPGIALSTSDIGWRSFSIQETWRSSLSCSSVVKGRKYSLIHRMNKDFEIREIMQSLKQEIFNKFFVFQEVILELVSIPVDEAAAANLLNHVMHEAKLKAALGRKRTSAFIDETIFCTDWSLPITAYNMFLSIMELTNGDYPPSTKVLVEEACYKAAYAKAWRK